MKVDKSSVLIGSDFEFFLVNEDGKVVSAIPFNTGTKENPQRLERNGCCIQHDGMLQECNVPPVRLTEVQDFWDNIAFLKGFIEGRHVGKDNLKVLCCATAEVDEDQLTDPRARIGGCDVSYNAWMGGEVNQKPNLEITNLRSCGLHFHFSFDDSDPDKCIELMKVFDVFVTIPCMFLDPDDKRRKLYGKAGEMRLCQWGNSRGFEARTLSSYLLEDKENIEYIFSQIEKMFDYYNNNSMDEIDRVSGKAVEAINNYNKDLAGEICDEFNNLVLLKQD